ncbi:unnamed protein product [Owenia fusiformis]|uniref:Uncharacterized protein n=1 Tax=Owenia fusiformis TaxID=6347 RepID=A0A8J1T5Y9_OWEFU|nr:unnamed protein product [Owenia fusiformis]
MAETENVDGPKIDFSKPWQFGDIIFIVEDKKIYANKTILSMWSPVMEAMFHRDFKEKNAMEINLPHKSYEEVIEFLKVLHPPNEEISGILSDSQAIDSVLHNSSFVDRNLKNSGSNITKILPLIQEYQVDILMKRCEDLLMCRSGCIQNYILAQKYNLQKLKDSSYAWLKRTPVGRLKQQPDFEKLDPEVLMEIFAEKCERFEKCQDSLREVKQVIERKKVNPTFAGAHMLCDTCQDARGQQVECMSCMKNCCEKVVDIIKQMDRC